MSLMKLHMNECKPLPTTHLLFNQFILALPGQGMAQSTNILIHNYLILSICYSNICSVTSVVFCALHSFYTFFSPFVIFLLEQF